MATKKYRRENYGGNIRETRKGNGRWQVRVRDLESGRLVPVGIERTKTDAKALLAAHVAAQRNGTWVHPRQEIPYRQEDVSLAGYSADWMALHEGRHAPRTRERYDGLLRLHIVPALGDTRLGDITPSAVRRWHAALLGAGVGNATVAKAYRLLHAILNTAVADEVLVRNPCLVKGAGSDRTPERPTASVAEVYALAGAVPGRYRVLVLLAAFSSLRFGELAALTRADVDLPKRTVRVERQMQRLDDGSTVIRPPKTEAGHRTVNIPTQVRDELIFHMARYTAEARKALVFTVSNGSPLDRSNWGRLWRRTRKAMGLPPLKFHDLRHTGNTWAAANGASRGPRG